MVYKNMQGVVSHFKKTETTSNDIRNWHKYLAWESSVTHRPSCENSIPRNICDVINAVRRENRPVNICDVINTVTVQDEHAHASDPGIITNRISCFMLSLYLHWILKHARIRIHTTHAHTRTYSTCTRAHMVNPSIGHINWYAIADKHMTWIK
jgi:hypothetical protein